MISFLLNILLLVSSVSFGADDNPVVRAEYLSYAPMQVATINIGCGNETATAKFCLGPGKATFKNGAVGYYAMRCALKSNGKCPSALVCAKESPDVLERSISGTFPIYPAEIDGAVPRTARTSQPRH